MIRPYLSDIINFHNIEIMMSNETDEIIEEIFESLLQRFQEKD